MSKRTRSAMQVFTLIVASTGFLKATFWPNYTTIMATPAFLIIVSWSLHRGKGLGIVRAMLEAVRRKDSS